MIVKIIQHLEYKISDTSLASALMDAEEKMEQGRLDWVIQISNNNKKLLKEYKNEKNKRL